MPVKSRCKLLAGMAVLLGLCAAGGGCQSSVLWRDGSACGCSSGGSSPVFMGLGGSAGCSSCGTLGLAGGDSAPSSSKIKPLFVHASTTNEPALASSRCDCCRSACLLRPVAQGCNCGDNSPWGVAKPIVAPSPYAPSETPTTVTADRAPPPAPPLLQPVRAEGDTSLTPIPIGSSDPPANLGANPESSRINAAPPPRQVETLPPPRPVSNSHSTTKLPQGYPELPAAMITHPVEAPREFDKRALSAYIIEPPDILAIEGIAALSDVNQPITGPHLVRPDGTIGLGTLGSVFVAGMTIDQAKLQIAQTLLASRDQSKTPAKDRLTLKNFMEGLKVDVAAYNSKFYYVITDGGGFGEQVIRLPCTGNEMVLDAIAQIQGLPSVASKKKIWLARATPYHSVPQILPIDWCGIVQRGSASTNYQIYPGDRIYVNSDPFIRTDSVLQKVLAPIERLMGATLLGSSVVNSIKNGSNSGGGGNNGVGR
jgi:polysaccharide export outer membrane protein